MIQYPKLYRGEGMMYNIAVVDDDASDRGEILGHLERYRREKDKSFTVTEFDNAVKFLEGYNPAYDIVFIDIQMPYLDGMTAAEKLREVDSAVPLVFITNMVKYAVKGYSVDAADFVVKPIAYGGFSVMLDKVLRLADKNGDAVMLKTAEGKIRLWLDRISHIEVTDHQVCYHADDGDHMVWGSLKEQESKLPTDRFAKCSNYCIVNLKYVAGITDGELKLSGGRSVPISRSKRKELTDRLLAYYGKYM